MAVFVHLQEDDVRQYLTQFNIGELVSFEGITKGIDNTNFKLTTSEGNYILTLLNPRFKEGDIPYYLSLMQHLQHKGIPCPKVVENKDGKLFGTLQNYFAVIVTFMPGHEVDTITIKHVQEMAKTNAQMHLAVSDFTMEHKNPFSFANCKKRIEACGDKPEELGKGTLMFLQEEIVYIEEHLPQYSSLPRGSVHADLFVNNVFFNTEDKLSAVLDFYWSCTEPFVYDLMVTLNDWCIEQGKVNKEKVSAFLNIYEDIRPLNEAEKAALPFFGRVAALRFASSRLYDWFHTPEDAIVNPHDPRDYFTILRLYQAGEVL